MLKKIRVKNVSSLNKTIPKKKFIQKYSNKFYLDIDKIKSEVWAISNKYKVIWTEYGPVLSVNLLNKYPAFSWGTYNILLNIFNLSNCLVTSNNAKLIKFNTNDYAIHPNIHSDLYLKEKYGNLVCLGDTLNPIKTCIERGELYEACEILINMLNGCRIEALSYYWSNIHYSRCNCCLDLIELGKRFCERCHS